MFLLSYVITAVVLSLASSQDVQLSLLSSNGKGLSIGDTLTINVTMKAVTDARNVILRVRVHKYLSVVSARATVYCLSTSLVCRGVNFPFTAEQIAVMTSGETEAQILAVNTFYKNWNVTVKIVMQVTNRREFFDSPQNGTFTATILYYKNRFDNNYFRSTKQISITYTSRRINAILSTENLTMFDGYLSTYLNEELWMNTEIYMAEGFTPIAVEFVLPHIAHPYRRCRSTLEPSSEQDCEILSLISLQVDPPDMSAVTVIIGSSLLYDSFLLPNITFSANLERIFFDFGVIRNIEDGFLNINDKIMVKIRVRIRQGYNRVGQILPFLSIANSSVVFNSESVNTELIIRVVGPDLSIYTQAQPQAGIQAGDVVTFTSTVYHSPVSTENITDLWLWSKLQGEGLVFIANISYHFSTNQYTPITADASYLNTGVKIGFLDKNDWIRLVFQVNITDEILINSHPTVRIDASYNGERENNAGKTYTAISTKPFAVKSLRYSSDFHMRFGVRIDEPVTITLNLGMPLGTLKDLSVRLEFQSSEFDELPIRMIQSNVKAGDGFLMDPAAANSTSFTWSSTPKLASLVRRSVSSIETEKILDENNQCISCKNEEVSANSSQKLRQKRQLQTATMFVMRFIGDVINPASGGISGNSFNVSMSFILTSLPTVHTGQTFTVAPSIVFSGKLFELGRQHIEIVEPQLSISKNVKYVRSDSSKMQIDVVISHLPNSTSPAYNILILDNTVGLNVRNHSVFSPSESTADISWENNLFALSVDELMVGENIILSYTATAIIAVNLENSSSDYNASVTYSSILASEAYSYEYPGRQYGPVHAAVCIQSLAKPITQVVLEHSYTAVSSVLAIFLGLFTIFVITFVISKTTPCYSYMWCGIKHQKKAIQIEESVTIQTLSDIETEKGYARPVTRRKIKVEESIIPLFGTPESRMENYRDLDCVDIDLSKQTEQTIEAQRTETVLDIVHIMVNHLRKRGILSAAASEKALQSFHQCWENRVSELHSAHDKLVDQKQSKIDIRHQIAGDNMAARHTKEREELQTKLQQLRVTDDEREEFVSLQVMQHTAELKELEHNLCLDRIEELQVLEQELLVQKRLAVKNCITNLMSFIQDQEETFSPELADSLNDLLQNVMTAIDKNFDEAIAQQRLALEDKYKFRQASIMQLESNDSKQNYLANQMVSKQTQFVNDLEKKGRLDADVAHKLITELKIDMKTLSEHINKEKLEQKQILHEKISERKRIQQQQMNHRRQLSVYRKIAQTSHDVALDPITYVEDLSSLLYQQRLELDKIDEETDNEAIREVELMHANITNKMKPSLQQRMEEFAEKLAHLGVTDAEIQSFHESYRRELSKLIKSLEQDQHKLLPSRQGNEDKRQLEVKKEAERTVKKQKQLRDEEKEMLRQLQFNQTSMSSEDRERIQRECARYLLLLNPGLAQDRIRQKQVLAEKMAARRQHLVEKIEQSHLINRKKRKKPASRRSNAKPADEAEKLHAIAEETLTVLLGQDVNMSEELEKVRAEMLEDRKERLRKQEEKLGAIIASLQITKAREMLQIEEQQKAIAKLHTNLMQDLHDNGLLNDAERKRILEQHQQDQAKLSKVLNSERQKQEEILNKKLAERLRQKETGLFSQHESEMREALSDTSVKGQVKRAQLAHKQLQDVETFRYQMENELRQELAEQKRQLQIKEQNSLQKQELDMIGDLSRLGHFNRLELSRILQLLFPSRPEEQLNAMLDNIQRREAVVMKVGVQREDREYDQTRASSLELRIKSSLQQSASASVPNKQYKLINPVNANESRNKVPSNRKAASKLPARKHKVVSGSTDMQQAQQPQGKKTRKNEISSVNS